MVDFVGVGTGYNKQINSDERRRLELAKAFSEFKSANPFATPMEMQSFVDQAAAGRNYLAGGMPSADVLNIIGERNAAALKAKRDAEAQTAAANKFDLFSKALNNADDLILRFGENPVDEETGLPTENFTKFLETLKEQSGVDFSGVITPNRINQVRTDRTLTLVPKVVDYIKSTDGTVSVEQAAAALGVPKFLVDGVTKRVNTILSREKADYLLDKKKDLLAQIEPIMKRGGNVEEAIKAFKTDAEEAGVDATELNTAIAEMKTEADRVAKVIKEDRDYDLAKRVQEVKIAFANDIQQVPQVKVAIARGDIEKAKEFMEKYLLDNYTTLSEDEKTAVKATFNTIVDGLTIEAQYNQDTLHNEKKAKADVAVAGVPAAVLKKSQDAGFVFFTGGQQGKVNPTTAGEANAAPAVAAELAKKYDLTNSYTLSLLSDYFMRVGKDEGNDYNKLLNGANTLLENTRGVTTLKEATQYQQDLVRKQIGDFDGDQTFDNWFTNEKEQYDKKFEEAKAALNAALNERDATKRLRQLRGVAAGLNQLQKVSAESFKVAFRYGQGKDRWITAGTPGWNQKLVDQWQTGANESKEALMEQITEQIGIAENQVQNTPRGPNLVDNISNQRKKTRRNGIGAVIGNTPDGPRRLLVKAFLEVSNLRADMINKVAEDQYQMFSSDPVSFIKTYYNDFYSAWIGANNQGNDL